MNKISRNIFLLSLFLLLAWLTFSFCWGERIKENNGLGWDGVYYARIALNPLEYITKTGVDNYGMSRILPSFVTHYTAQFFGYDLGTNLRNPEAVINTFAFYNIALILISVFIFSLIAKQFKWNASILILGFSALFINFPILKLSTFNPILTDFFAFMMILLIFYFYIRGWQLLLFFTALLASFVWPTMIYTSLPLLIYKFKNSDYKKFEPSRFSNILAAMAAVILSAGVLFDYYFMGFKIPLNFGVNPVNEKLIAFSIIMFFLYIFFMFRQFFDFEYFKLNLFSTMNLRGIILAVILFASVKLIILIFSRGSFYLTPLLFVRNTGQYAIVNPLVSVVSHVFYFGPLVVLTILFWNNVVSIAKQYGPGLMLFLMFNALLSIASESRGLMAAWPVFAILTCEAISRRGISLRMAYSLLGIGLLISRFWLSINGKENWTGPYTEFPYQMYFMNFGPWLSNSMYYVFAVITAVLFVWLFFFMRNYEEFEAITPADKSSQ